MAKKVSVSISKKVSKYVAKHKDDETNYGVINLPGGINNGIAQLNDCKIDNYKSGAYKGEPYFLANGIVISPNESADGTPVKGLRTQIMVPLCDTKKQNGEITSVEDHVETLLNELRKLGVDTSEMDDEGLEDAMEELKEAAPYFRFSTSQAEPTKQYPNPRVWENWHGVRGLEDYEPEEDEQEDEVEEEIEEEEEVEEEEKKPVKKKPVKKSTKKKPEPEPEPEEEEQEEEEKEDGTLALAKLADEGDEEAAATLTEICEAGGVDPEEYETWEEAVSNLEQEDEESEEEEDEEDEEEEEVAEEIVPEKEEVYYYKPPRKKAKVEVEVTMVSKAKKTCNLKDLENEGKIYKAVPWSDLSTEAE